MRTAHRISKSLNMWGILLHTGYCLLAIDTVHTILIWRQIKFLFSVLRKGKSEYRQRPFGSVVLRIRIQCVAQLILDIVWCPIVLTFSFTFSEKWAEYNRRDGKKECIIQIKSIFLLFPIFISNTSSSWAYVRFLRNNSNHSLEF